MESITDMQWFLLLSTFDIIFTLIVINCIFTKSERNHNELY